MLWCWQTTLHGKGTPLLPWLATEAGTAASPATPPTRSTRRCRGRARTTPCCRWERAGGKIRVATCRRTNIYFMELYGNPFIYVMYFRDKRRRERRASTETATEPELEEGDDSVTGPIGAIHWGQNRRETRARYHYNAGTELCREPGSIIWDLKKFSDNEFTVNQLKLDKSKKVLISRF